LHGDGLAAGQEIGQAYGPRRRLRRQAQDDQVRGNGALEAGDALRQLLEGGASGEPLEGRGTREGRRDIGEPQLREQQQHGPGHRDRGQQQS
jgi:hypothetical protein